LTTRISVHDAIEALARDPLRHVVLLKQLLAYPEHVEVHRVCDDDGAATLVALDASVSPYDRLTYPKADVVAFISSDHPRLTGELLSRLPPAVGIVFKLAREADLAPVALRFPVVRRTAFISFSARGGAEPDPGALTTSRPGAAAFDLFETQGHARDWLEPLLRNGKAFACVLSCEGNALSACFAFENYGRVWEVGGVVTTETERRKGLAGRVVRTALAELGRRALVPRYQVEEGNAASIQLARSVGLAPFLTLVHYAHAC
jgi:hypothetical protein